MQNPQPWIAGLRATHAAILVLVVLTRRRPNVQLGLFLLISGAVYMAQYLHTFLHARWRRLGFTQDYFNDDRGVFITFVYSMPLLCIAAGQMVGMMWLLPCDAVPSTTAWVRTSAA